MKIGDTVVILTGLERRPIVGKLVGQGAFNELLVRCGDKQFVRDQKRVHTLAQARKKPWWKRYVKILQGQKRR